MNQVAELVLSVSDELATLEDRDVDQSIERALGRAGEIAGADRCYVFLLSGETESVSNTHEWCAPGVETARDALQNLPLDTFPWAFRLLAGTEELFVPDVSAAPAGPERAEWERERIQSLFCTPLRVHGVPTGFLGCDWVRRADPLDAPIRQLIRVAAALVAGAFERRRAYRSLEYRSRFEELVLRISSRFIDLRGDEVGPAIDEALGAIARFVGVEAGSVMRFQEDGSARAAHLWRAPEATMPVTAEALTLPPAVASWWLERMRDDRPIVATSVDSIGTPEARAALTAQGIGATVDLPLFAGGQIAGFVSFATVRRPRSWTPDEVKLLQLAAQVISHTLARAEADRAESKLQEQLRQTQKMDVVGQLAGGVAHDFNNLLLSITVCSDIALRTVPAEATAARQALGEIRDAADRAATLTRQLLTFSQRRVVQVRPVDLNALVDEMLRMVRRIVNESIEIDFRPGRDVGTLRADPSQIEQVLMNLCVNARDAMPTGGRLTIETRIVPRDAVRLGPAPAADASRWVRLTVRDSGAGIEESVRDRVFEPFFTTKPPGKGSGLGLPIVYGIVRQHGGAIHLESEIGRGTTFEIDLPVDVRPLEPSATGRGTAERLGNETVLLAEDDEAVRRTVTTLLEHAGYTVLGARDGEHAVEIFREKGPAVDLVLLDVVMPRKGGLEAWREIDAIRPGVPTLFSSGYSVAVFPPGFFDDGRQRLIEKPYDSSTLLGQIREILDRPR